jgi:hypothetical protein
MKKENIKLIKLFEEIVNEVGDLNNIPVFEYSLNSNGGTFDFEFKDDKAECRVSFTQMPTEVYHLIDLPPIVPRNKEIISVGFDIEGTDDQYLKSNYRLLLRIIKTVAEIITDSLYRYPKDAIFVVIEIKQDVDLMIPKKWIYIKWYYNKIFQACIEWVKEVFQQMT